MVYIVCSKNQFCLNGWEYFGLSKDGSKIIGYHDPNLADKFKTVKDAKVFSSRFDYDTKVEKLDKHQKIFVNSDYVYRSIPLIDTSMSIKYDADKHTQIDVLNFKINHRKRSDKSIRYEDYRTWPELWSVFKHLWSFESYSKNNGAVQMFTCSIRVNKKSDFKEFKEDLELVKPHCTFVSDDGYLVFPIFDHDLSEYGTRYLHYKTDEDCKIVESRWSEYVGDLKKCFDIMEAKFYYD
jgi:hypothetical protein